MAQVRTDGPAESRTGTRSFCAMAWGIAVSILALAAVYADRSGAVGETLLSFLETPFEWLIDRGGSLYHRSGELLAPLRLPALAVLAAWLIVARRRPERGSRVQLPVALGIAWIAQSYLLGGRLLLGSLLYAAAIAVYLLPRHPPPAPARELPLRVEMLAFGFLLALFVAMCLYRLDVYPSLYLDETAYHAASRMQLGEIERGKTWVYPFERFQAQPIPLLMHSAAVYLLSPGILPLRLVSIAAAVAGLLLVSVAVRNRCGARPMLLTLALCACSPAFLGFSRAGLYIGISVLHGAACVCALLRLGDRLDRSSALLLGLALGSAFYLYQLSWFSPLLVMAALLAWPELWRRAAARRLVALSGAVAVLCVAPGVLLLHEGLRTVRAQTFDKAYWSWGEGSDWEGQAMLQALAPHSWSEAEANELARRLRGEGVEVSTSSTRSGRSVLLAGGSVAAVEVAVSRLQEASWSVLMDSLTPPTPWRNLKGMLARLFIAPGGQNLVRVFEEPILNPALAPLVVLGLAAALRRLHRPCMRVLVIWVLGAAFLPAAIAGDTPRRAALMFPFLQVLMSLPLAELLTAGGDRSRWRRGAATAAVGGFLAVALVMGGHLYFRHWDVPSNGSATGSQLELLKVLKRLPAGERVLVWPFHPQLERLLERLQEEPTSGSQRRVFVAHEAKATKDGVLRISCRHAPPFAWIAPAGERVRERFSALDRAFLVSEEQWGAYRVIQISDRAPGSGVCTSGDALVTPLSRSSQ